MYLNSFHACIKLHILPQSGVRAKVGLELLNLLSQRHSLWQCKTMDKPLNVEHLLIQHCPHNSRVCWLDRQFAQDTGDIPCCNIIRSPLPLFALSPTSTNNSQNNTNNGILIFLFFFVLNNLMAFIVCHKADYSVGDTIDKHAEKEFDKTDMAPDTSDKAEPQENTP